MCCCGGREEKRIIFRVYSSVHTKQWGKQKLSNLIVSDHVLFATEISGCERNLVQKRLISVLTYQLIATAIKLSVFVPVDGWPFKVEVD